MTGTLHQLGMKHGTDKATFHGYCDFYEDQLPGRDFDGRLLEIGIMDGASLMMWRDYYPAAKIVGVDNDKRRGTRKFAGVRTAWLDMTESDEVELLTERLGPFDVIIDDGSHMTADQQKTFSLLWPNVSPGGLYVIEDLHTSYMSNYVNSTKTTMDFLLESHHDVAFFGRGQGEAEGFISRHGFDPEFVRWLGNPENVESITAVIRKPL